jgi:hypothetical protein
MSADTAGAAAAIRPDKDQEDADKQLRKDALERLEDARQQKAVFQLDLREGYYFAAPHRRRSAYSASQPEKSTKHDASFLNTSFGFEVCGDFPTVMINTFFPENVAWLTRKAGPVVPKDQKAAVEKQAAEQDEIVFSSIRASNFYAECGKSFNPDLALGTVALWIDHPVAWAHPRVQSVPLRELEINIGPDGNVDDRFVVRHTKLRYLSKLLPNIAMPKKIADRRAKDGNKSCVIIWGFWRIYDDTLTEKWQHVVLVDNVLVHKAEIKGEGSCPLQVARFNPTPEWAFGIGPLIQALAELRMVDELNGKKIKNVDMLLAPPISFPDDSFANISDGIEAGMAYSLRPGTEGAIKNIYDPPSPDPAIYFTQDMEQRIKRLFFLDWPQQRGDTPPTATQWLDEMTLAQRRIGTPGLAFYQEFCVGIFQRWVYLLEKAKQIQPVTYEGEGKKRIPISLIPQNPAQRSADQEEVALFTRFAQIGGAAFPEEWKIETDGRQTLQNVAKKMGVTKLWAQRSDDQKQAALANIQKLMSGTPASAPAIPGGAGPAAPDTAGPAPNQPTYALRGRGL